MEGLKRDDYHADVTKGAKGGYRASTFAQRFGIIGPESLEIQYDQAAVSQSVLQLRRTMQMNQSTKAQFNLDEGALIDVNNLATVTAGNTRVFGKKSRPSKHSYHWVVMLDCSGSTRGHEIQQIRMIGAMLGDVFSRLNHGFEIYGHTSCPANADQAVFARDGRWSGTRLTVAKVKGPEESWGENNLKRLRKLQGAAGNLDGHATRWARKRLDAAPKNPTDRILLYVTDGHMPAENGIEESEILKEELRYFKRTQGYAMAGLGIGTDSPTEHGLPTLVINKDTDLVGLGPFVQTLI